MKFYILIFLTTIIGLSIGQQRQAYTYAVSRLDHCERAIWSCCQSDRVTYVIPVSCFEQNQCFGLHWLGNRACSSGMLNSVARKIQISMQDFVRNQQSSFRFAFGGSTFLP